MTETNIVSRRFSTADQVEFATLSGDWNPIHLDPRAARRTIAGDVVSHGVHVALWALNQIAEQRSAGDLLSSFRAQFHKFVYLDRDVALRNISRSGDAISAEVVADGMVVTAVSVMLGARECAEPDEFEPFAVTALERTPLVRSLSEIDGLAGWLTPPKSDALAAQMFPELCDWVGERRVVSLAQMSTVVGMACPGLHSIFSTVSARLTAAESGKPGLGWRASVPDARYPRIDLAMAGSGVRAEAKAIVRPPPVAPPTIASLSAEVSATEFVGRRALIVGGSRGLGAATAKLLAAGGAKVVVTYVNGEAEAADVVADIRAHYGQTAARAVRCDARGDLELQLSGCLDDITHLYYFATPHITRPSAALFSPSTFAAFAEIYISRFHQLCGVVLDATADEELNVFYPSTVYVDERPRGMIEYAMCKAAAELLCQDLVRAFPRLAISAPRLPRVLTDQTAVAIPLKSKEAAAVMLPLLRVERPGRQND